jgi:hypothetical protein
MDLGSALALASGIAALGAGVWKSTHLVKSTRTVSPNQGGVPTGGADGSDLLDTGREMYERGRKLADEAAEMFERGRLIVERQRDPERSPRER